MEVYCVTSLGVEAQVTQSTCSKEFVNIIITLGASAALALSSSYARCIHCAGADYDTVASTEACVGRMCNVMIKLCCVVHY